MTTLHPQIPDPSSTILLVEDELVIRMNVADYLVDRGFLVVEASNATEALGYLTSSVVEIDLVFTDVRMPGKMDGLALARWIQQHRVGLPVIVTSGDVGRENVSTKTFPADFFFPKPYELNTIAEAIVKLTQPVAA